MNLPKLFEGALAHTIVTHAKLTTLPRIRVWQQVDGDARWTSSADRVFPMIDIRTGSPRVDPENGATCLCNVAVLIVTALEDDQTHAQISSIYDAVQTVMDALYAQFRSGVAGAERTTFDAYITDHNPNPPATISVGGFEYGDPLDPYDEGGAQFIGMNFIIHFARSDF